jgi:phosphoenolpyruvate-protein kinase (PTS system EI component)
VGVCGALASESLAVPLLLGLGVDELSVSVPLIPTIKARVRELEFKDCQGIGAARCWRWKVQSRCGPPCSRQTLLIQCWSIEHV